MGRYNRLGWTLHFSTIETALVLAPHTDDGEFGLGGTIAKLTAAGTRVVYVAFSAAEQSVLPHLPRDILRQEVKQATTSLGIQECLVLDFEVRRFPEFRQQLLDTMINLNSEYAPDLVFLPSTNDMHQDHQTVSGEGFRAFKKTSILGYELPWNNLQFPTGSFVRLSDVEMERKVAALGLYQSQAHRPYASPETIRGIARTRGVQIGSTFAEAFEVIRWVID
jgi:LmbE family N-acetylglucosaminyl deacetylase